LRNSCEEKDVSDVLLAVLMLAEPAVSSAERICETLRSAFPEQKVHVESADERGVYSLALGEYMLFVALMPGPVPWDQLESLTQAAWHWRESEAELRAHHAQVLITIPNGPPDPVDGDLLLTRVTAAILEVQPAIGVFWGGPAISSREMFLAAGRDASREGFIPVLLWVSFNFLEEANGEHAIVTQGMERLGHREMELLGDPTSEDSLEYALDMACYVLRQGPILKPGQNCGRTAEERFPITHRPWRWDASKTAIILDMRKK
jgi:hypothetical protein